MRLRDQIEKANILSMRCALKKAQGYDELQKEELIKECCLVVSTYYTSLEDGREVDDVEALFAMEIKKAIRFLTEPSIKNYEQLLSTDTKDAIKYFTLIKKYGKWIIPFLDYKNRLKRHFNIK